MLRYLGLLSLFVVTASQPLSAQDDPWTGWRFGIHGGGARSNATANLSNGDRFCYRESAASGAGTATAECTFTDDTVGTNARAEVIQGGSGSIGAAAAEGSTVPPGTAAAVAVAAGSAGTTATSEATAVGLPNNLATASSSTFANNGFGSASSLAFGLLNAFNLGNGGDFNATGFAFGGHVGYSVRQANNIVIGFEVDVTATPGGEAKTSDASGFTVPDLSGGGGAGAAGAAAVGTPAPVAVVPSGDTSYSRTVAVDNKLLASARFRIGYAMGNFLPYLTAGLAYGRFNVDVAAHLTSDLPLQTTSFSRSSNRSYNENAFGGVFGGGLAWRLAGDVVMSAEGLYYAFNEKLDISDALLDSNSVQTVEIKDIIEARLKVSVPLN